MSERVSERASGRGGVVTNKRVNETVRAHAHAHVCVCAHAPMCMRVCVRVGLDVYVWVS